MRIVHVIYALNTGGAETMLVDIVNEQGKRADVSIVIVNNLINEDIVKNISSKVHVYRIQRKPGSRLPWKIIKLNLLLNELRPEVVHCHNHTLINLLHFPGKSKKYLTVHDIAYPDTNFYKFDKLFAISNSVRNDIVVRGNYKVKVVYNGITVDAIKKKEWLGKHETFRIVQVSRLDHEKKGQHILLQALAWLKQNKHAIKFSIDFIGEGKSIDFLQNLVNEKHLHQQVRFLGNRTRSYIYENLCTYDLLVQPSLFEGFGLTVAEALAAKVPVLVSNIDGPMEIIQNGKYGNYFQTENHNECALKIIAIAERFNEQQALAEKAYNHCVRNFSITETANNYLSNY